MDCSDCNRDGKELFSMIRVLFFLLFVISFSFSLEVTEPLFPKGEKLEKFVMNSTIGAVRDSLISHNGKFIISAEESYPTKLKFLDTTSKKLFYIKKIKGYIQHLSISTDDKLLVFYSDNNISFFNIKEKKIIKAITIKEDVTQLDLSSDRNFLVYATDKQVHLYDIKLNKPIYFFKHKKIKKLLISQKNSYLVILTDEKKPKIELYDLKTSMLLKTFKLKNSDDIIEDIDINKNEKSIAVISSKGIKIINIENQNIDILKDGNFDLVRFLNNEKLITYSYRGIDIWNIQQKVNLSHINQSVYNYSKVSVSKDCKFTLTLNYSSKLNLVNLYTAKIYSFNKFLNISKAIYLKNSKQIISIDDDKGINFWSLTDNKLEHILDKNKSIDDISIDANQKYLLYSFDNHIKLIDLDSKKVVYQHSEQNGTIEKVAISLDSTKIAFIYRENYKIKEKVKILDINQSKIINSIDGEYYHLKFLNNYQLYRGGALGDNIFDIEQNRLVEDNRSITFYTSNNYYEIFNEANESIEVKNLKTGKTEYVLPMDNKDADIRILDIIDGLIFIKDFTSNSLKVWNLKEQKYQDRKELKKKYHTISYTRNHIELLNLNKNIIEKEIYIQKNSNWIVIDKIQNRFFHHTKEQLFLRDKKFDFIDSQNDINPHSIEIYTPKDIHLINNSTTTFDIQIKNKTDKSLYWIKPIVNDSNLTLEADSIIELKPYEAKRVKVSLTYNDKLSKSFLKIVNLQILIGHKNIEDLSLNLNIEKKLEINIDKLILNETGFHLTINNYSDKNLTQVNVVISEGNKSVKYNKIYEYLPLSIETNISKTFNIPNDANFSHWEKGHDFIITVGAKEIGNYVFKQYVVYDTPKVLYFYIAILSMGLLLLLALIGYSIYNFFYLGKFDKNIKKIINEPSKIYDMPLTKLHYYKKFLKRGVDSYNIDFKYIFENDLDKVSKFFELTDDERCNIISERVKGKVNKLEDNFFEITLNKNFEIKVKKVLCYFVKKIDTEQLYNILEKKKNDPILIFANSEEQQQRLSEDSKLYTLKNIITIESRNLKILLLQQNHSRSLSQILSLKLDRKIISPYTIKGGVKNESYFFGREDIIHHITNRELSSYLIVGARQIGKTSLLMALERKFKLKKELETIYITLSSGHIIRRLASRLKIDKNSTLEEVEEYILDSDKTYLFLIDEVDGFIKREKENHYKILDTFRSLSQEGKAYFIMAGFWELYHQATYDYQSPIKNFGEIITIDKLEEDACYKLLFQPMMALNIVYKNEDDIPKIINFLGHRANLIATVANKIIGNLEPCRSEIYSKDVDKALLSREIMENFNSWENLSNDDFKSDIDKFIIYSTITLNSFTIRKIINFFKKLEVDKVTIDEIKESLDRLELSYILKRTEQNYSYTIPLFQRYLQKKDIEAIMREKIYEFRRKYG